MLEEAGLISRHRSSGDVRRRYVSLDPAAPAEMGAEMAGHVLAGEIRALVASVARRGGIPAQAALLVCSQNSARSQLAATLWRSITEEPATSAGTRPADRVQPGAVAS